MANSLYFKSVILAKFRNFNRAKLDLGSKTTIIIGKNGVGKSNLLVAIYSILSSVFPKFLDDSKSVDGVQSNLKDMVLQPLDFYYMKGDYHYPIAINGVMQSSEGEEFIKWQLSKLSDKKQFETNFEVGEQFYSKVLKENRLPVFAFYSDTFPHNQERCANEIMSKEEVNSPLLSDLDDAMREKDINPLELWKKCYVMSWRNAHMGNDKEDEDYCKAIEEVLQDFTQPISGNKNNSELTVKSLVVDTKDNVDVIVVQFMDGRRIPFDLLSQGYKRIISIVLDLATRGLLLQKTCNPYGVVLIDDIDLHLHPSLAQELLQRLRRSFSYVQFVISTHSPFVIGDFRHDDDNVLYKIDVTEDGPKITKLQNFYGMDYITVLRSVMDTPERNSNLQNLVGAYKYWKQIGDKERLGRLEGLIKNHVGGDSEFYKALIDS